MKTPHHSVSGRSYLASSPDSSNVAVFEVSPSPTGSPHLHHSAWSHHALLSTSQGDWVWLKKCPSGMVSSVNSSTENAFVTVTCTD